MTKKINILFLAMIFIILFRGNVYADELTFAVAPSKIVNLVIEPGNKETLQFKVANRSVFSNTQNSKNELYDFRILVEAKIYDSDGLEIKNTDIMKFSKNIMTCKPNKTDMVEVTVDIPKTFEKNSYKVDLVFTREPIAGVEDVSNTNTISSIKVPIYMGVGNPDEYSKLKTDYEIEQFYIDFGEPKNISYYVKENLKDLITFNPKTVLNVFESISEKDIYVIRKEDSLIIDSITDIFTSLDNVLTYNSSVTKYKYVSLNKSDYNKVVKNIKFDNKSVKFYLEDDYFIEIKCEDRVVENLKTQINTLIKENSLKSPDFKFFAQNLKVPKNINYNLPKYNIDIFLKNTGEKETFITSSMVLKKDSSNDIGNARLDLLTLQKNSTEQISVDLNMLNDLSNGSYNLYGSFTDVKNINKTANFKFDVNLDLDKQIFMITLIVYILCLLGVAVIITIPLIRMKRKKAIVGYVIKESISYSDIESNNDNFEIYKDLLNIKEINELDKYKIVDSVDVIVRDKCCEKANSIFVLHKGTFIELVEDDIEEKNINWIKIKFYK